MPSSTRYIYEYTRAFQCQNKKLIKVDFNHEENLTKGVGRNTKQIKIRMNLFVSDTKVIKFIDISLHNVIFATRVQLNSDEN